MPALTCPTCGATDQTDAACRRCRSDLRLLHRLEADRITERHKLARALVDERWSDALLSAQYLHVLRQDDESFRMLAVCQLLNDQIEAACATYRRHRAPGNAPPA